MLKSLHVSSMDAAGLTGGHEHRALFQASTIEAVLDGKYDGDLTFADLAERGDTGLGTLNALDGEMIALDGRFFRADVNGRISEIDPGTKTPFAVVVEFDPDLSVGLEGPIDRDAAYDRIKALLPADLPLAAIRIDGRFDSVTARSVPAQEKPYRPLAEVIDSQQVFEIPSCEGSLIGFHFPDWSEGIEVAGFHLHFIDSTRTRGGHVLDFTLAEGTLMAESSSDLEVELPPGVDLACGETASGIHEAIEKTERLG